jgi:hypothetical protein
MHDIRTHNRVFLRNNDELEPGSILRVDLPDGAYGSLRAIKSVDAHTTLARWHLTGSRFDGEVFKLTRLDLGIPVQSGRLEAGWHCDLEWVGLHIGEQANRPGWARVWVAAEHAKMNPQSP